MYDIHVRRWNIHTRTKAEMKLSANHFVCLRNFFINVAKDRKNIEEKCYVMLGLLYSFFNQFSISCESSLKVH